MSILTKILNFYKPCIVQFRDGTYGIREYRLIYVYRDLTKNNFTCLWSSRNRYFLNGDCKVAELNEILKFFASLNKTRNEKKERKKKIKNGRTYSILLYEGEQNESFKKD